MEGREESEGGGVEWWGGGREREGREGKERGRGRIRRREREGRRVREEGREGRGRVNELYLDKM